jgi:hypothetical protein
VLRQERRTEILVERITRHLQGPLVNGKRQLAIRRPPARSVDHGRVCLQLPAPGCGPTLAVSQPKEDISISSYADISTSMLQVLKPGA